MIDLLYVSYNRLAYTRETFTALVENTEWGHVERLFVVDDDSSDGTMEFLHEASKAVPTEVTLRHGRLGGPVAAMNWYLEHASPGVEIFGKVDNDMVVCPGWLREMLLVLDDHPELDILGMEPFVGDPTMPPSPRTLTPCEHIGGKGLLRHRAFEGRTMTANGYFGFTGFQTSNPEITKAWITPDLPVFGLDQMVDGPYRDLATVYEEKGWQRMWPAYGSDEHYAWWTPAFPLA